MMTRTYGERVDDRLEAGYRAKLDSEKDAVKMVEATIFAGAISPRKQNTNRGVEERLTRS